MATKIHRYVRVAITAVVHARKTMGTMKEIAEYLTKELDERRKVLFDRSIDMNTNDFRLASLQWSHICMAANMVDQYERSFINFELIAIDKLKEKK